MDSRADRAGSGAQGKRGGTRNGHTARDASPPLADRHVLKPAPVTSDEALGDSAQKPAAPSKGPATTSATKEKQSAFLAIQENALAAASLDELAASFRSLVTLIRDHRKSAPTTACLDALGTFQARLAAHHEFPREEETTVSFSAILTKSVAAPIQLLTAQLQAQQQSIQAISKSVDSVKTAQLTARACASSPLSSHETTPSPKPKPVPITSTPDERILLRCDGEAPPIFGLHYHQLVPEVNATLVSLRLPEITCASRSKDGGLFLVPESREAVSVLEKAWLLWGPKIFPGARIIPPAVYSHIQLDGIPYAAAPELKALASEIEERYPNLGPVVGTPNWVNTPPSEAQTSAAIAAGKKPRFAGSVIVRLTSREMVDVAVSLGRLRVAGSAVTVVRSFPHLRVKRCWRCHKFGHIKEKCTVKEAKCGGCGENEHGALCSAKPKCLNCGGDHRADIFSCPTRKRIAETLRLRAVELTNFLNSTTSVPIPSPAPRLPDSL